MSKKRVLVIGFVFSLLSNIVMGAYLAPRLHNRLKPYFGGVLSASYDYRNNAHYEIENKIYPIDEGDVDAVFLGDSITCYGEWEAWYRDYAVLNRGIGSDTTEGVLNRLDDVTSHTPEYIFLMIGINDIGKGIAADVTVSNMRDILGRLTADLPGCEIYVFSMLPSRMLTDGIIGDVNDAYAELANNYSNVTYIDMYDDYKCDGVQDKELFTDDGVHLTGKGYLAWMKHIDPILGR